MTSRRTRVLRFVLLFALATGLAGPGLAQEVARIPIIDAPPQTPGLGGGIRLNSSPYVGQTDVDDLVPLYLYEGKYLFAHGTKFGAHVYRDDTFTLDVGARYQFLKLDPDPDDPLFDGVLERKQTVEGGIEGSMKGGWGILQLGWWTDVQDRHNGSQFELTYRYRFDFGKWMISPYVSAKWLDDDMVGYYFGVSPGESHAGLPAYAPGDAINLEWGVNTWWQLTDRVFAFGNLGVVALDSAITRSPLVAEDSAAAVFVGGGYLFGGEKGNVYGAGGTGNPWSWRVNYGYQAASNIFPKLMSGQIQSNDEADTNISGLTLGKLFQGGDRMEVWGKFALYRHYEEPLQDDFWSYNAYVILMGKGYSPWSQKLAFRWGFGLGVSYAEEVPIIEQIKQARKGENTNRLLNYLEFQVDFPVERLIKSKFTRDCFVGMTVAHRSGIFATSELLGSVNGGSDWVTLSYECVR